MDNRRLAAVLIVLLVIIAPISYVAYSYHSFNGLINPGTPKTSAEYVVVYTPSAQFYTLTAEEYRQLLESGEKLPPGSKLFNVTVDSYITGSPGVDLNLTLRSVYRQFTIVMGDPSVINCKDNPQLYVGDCRYRTLAVSEISGVVASIFAANYYLKGINMGYDNVTAKQYAFNQTQLGYRKTYLNFWTKVDLGRGKIGNEEHLAVLLIGPAEGAKENRIFTPRRGVLVIEGTTDETLRAEVVLIENIISFKWPEGNETKTINITGG
ncbi:hypothetical protein CL1_0277 [Thermococcus cleftensis]|uniref:Uncharacterized protein n=1 Tax=Thermococcus cleftensis (strain DSM 27260 / KACC 17922 / CL1) TaxID=163003 RepID=I3ZS05_THECF|nr:MULTISPECIES: hypothetical protein [Thermococcus]AFL94489.1 hypothetical protein CL1_0277 [Thermococcus cleftensis]NJE03155.1 hypothetical protein [Thermococcus sp. MV11]